MEKIEHLISVRCELGEGPLWNQMESALYWTDINDCCIYRYWPATGKSARYKLDVKVGCFAFRKSGGFVIGAENGFAFWNPPNSKVDYLMKFPEIIPTARFNDGKADRQGRFWADTISKQPDNHLYRLDSDHQIKVMESGITISNGMGWSPDNRIMYYTDSAVHTIYAYNFNASDGSLSNRRVLIRIPEKVGVPDGLTVDREGAIWTAIWNGWRIQRYMPDGLLEREIKLPVQCPSSLTFGGEKLNELYITSAQSDLSTQQRKTQTMAGDIFRLKTSVPGMAEPTYSG